MIAVCLPPMWPGEQPRRRRPGPAAAQPVPAARLPAARLPAATAVRRAATRLLERTHGHGRPAARAGSRRPYEAHCRRRRRAVVVAAAVTGAVLLGGNEGRAEPGPTASSSASASAADDPRAGTTARSRPSRAGVSWPTRTMASPSTYRPLVPQSPTWVTYVAEDDDPEEKPLVAMNAPAVLEEKWCLRRTATGTAGSTTHRWRAPAHRGNNGARGTEEIARNDSAAWAYGAFAQPARDKVTTGPVTSFTTRLRHQGQCRHLPFVRGREEGQVRRGRQGDDVRLRSADGDLVSLVVLRRRGRRRRGSGRHRPEDPPPPSESSRRRTPERTRVHDFGTSPTRAGDRIVSWAALG